MSHVTDFLLRGITEGQTPCGADKVVATGATGGGYLLISNTDASVAAYLTFSGATADANKFTLPAGKDIMIPVADVTKVRCYSAGTPVLAWALLRA